MNALILSLLERFIEELISDNPKLEKDLSDESIKDTMNNVVDEMIHILDDYTDNME